MIPVQFSPQAAKYIKKLKDKKLKKLYAKYLRVIGIDVEIPEIKRKEIIK